MIKRIFFIFILFLTTNAYCDSESTIGGKTSRSHIIQDEGVSLRPRSYLNFTGSGVSCTDSGGKTVCSISGGGGSAGALDVQLSGVSVCTDSSCDTVTFSNDFSITESATGTASIGLSNITVDTIEALSIDVGTIASNTLSIGDGSSGNVVLTFDGDAGTDGTFTYNITKDSFVFSNVVKFFSDAAPVVDTAADWAFDNDLWDTNRGAFLYYDGTATAAVVGVLSPGDCDVDEIPKKTAAGWTCQADSTGTGLGDNLSSSTNEILSDSGSFVLGGTGNVNNEALTFDFETTANKVAVTTTTGVTTLDLGALVVQAGSFEAAASSTPTQSFTDSDTEAGDVSAQIVVNATTTGDTVEVVDMTFSTQIDGAMTAFITRDGSGPSTTIANLTATNANLTTPALGTPSAINLTNATGFPARVVSIKLTEDGGTALATTDTVHFFIPSDLNGMNLVGVSAGVSTASSSGNPTFQIRNVTDSTDMLSTALTIDANEKHSSTAATAAVIDTNNDDVVTGDELKVNCTTAGTGTKGVQIDLKFSLP